MGKHSRSPSPSSSSGSERRQRKDKKHKKEKHKSKDKHKKHKKHRRSASPDARLAAAKAFLQDVLKQGGGGDAAAAAAAAVFAAEQRAVAAGGSGREAKRKQRAPKPKPPGVADIGADDYFQKSGEFTAWLLEERGKYFNELTSEQSHELFGEFVDDWNGGHLPLKFYSGLVQAPLKRTTHAWGFQSKPRAGGGVAALFADQAEAAAAARAGSRAAEGTERRKWRGEQKELLDEMLPKATGREALVEKRIARREAARAREDSPELTRVTGGGDVMGGDDSFAAAKAREAAVSARRNQRQAVKREELSGKLAAVAAAEEEKMAQFRALLSRGPITIPKRQ